MSGATTAGSVLETTRVGGGSLLDALRAAAEVDLESVLAVLESLSFATQLQAIGELYEGRELAASTIDQDQLTYPHPPSLRLWRELGDEGVAWARAWAPRLTSVEHSLQSRPGLHRLVFLALARGGVAIAPEWEPAFWLGGGDEHYDSLVRELVRALPAERRAAVVLAQMEKQRSRPDGIRGAIAVLDELGSPEIAAKALEMAGRTDFPGKKPALAMLKSFAKRHSRTKDAPPARLRWLGVTTPSDPALLGATELAQLERVSRDFLADDATLTPARLLADGLVERHVIGDAKGKPLYDVWIVMSDTGGIFDTGTTRELAPIIQGAIELDDAATKAALEAAIRPPKPRRKPAPKTKSSKKKPR